MTVNAALQPTRSIFWPACVCAEWPKLATPDAHIPPLSDANGCELCTSLVSFQRSQFVFSLKLHCYQAQYSFGLTGSHDPTFGCLVEVNLTVLQAKT